jgi:hypothetical protein
MIKKVVIETCGWLGVIAILSGYALVSFSYIAPGSLIYFALNVVGGCGMILSAYPKRAYQPIVLNAVWISIALMSFLSTN